MLTLGVWALLALVLGAPALGGALSNTLGDTDDALRLTLVRDLLAGHAAWYDQHLARLQPPVGMDVHWSRLVDGGIAALETAFRLFLEPAQAEYAVRVAWPLLWVGPAVAATLYIANRLGGRLGAMAAALLLSTSYLIFWQWSPGRLDHHDLQITAALVTLAGGVAGGRRGALLAGVTTALGLAVGIEGLPFLAFVGMAFALRFALAPAAQAAATRAYAASLLVALPVLYLLQTPPLWWLLARCDVLAINLLAAVATGCGGLLLSMRLAARAGVMPRMLWLAAVGAVSAAVYLGLEPRCIAGPFAQVDPRVFSIWLNKVNEVRPLAHFLPLLAGDVVSAAASILFGALAWLWLGRRRANRTEAWGLVGACFGLAALGTLGAIRLAAYCEFFAVALTAAAVADIASNIQRWRLAATTALAIALSPTWPAALAGVVRHPPANPLASKRLDCISPTGLANLARLPPGLVLNEIDLGPYILAATPHQVLSAPYHRMGWGIIAADAALAAPPGRDEAEARRLGATYVVTCSAHADYERRKELSRQSLQARLDRSETPGWLEPLSAPTAPLRVLRVKPPSPPRRYPDRAP